jgi:hypothetical protein
MRCTLGFATNQKHFSLMELRSLLNVVKSVWISRETMSKNDVIIMSVSFIFYIKNKFSLAFISPRTWKDDYKSRYIHTSTYAAEV